MATDPIYQPITVDEFLAMNFGTDRRFELDNGVIQMMTGGSALHAHVAGNVYLALRLKLGRSRCRPFNSDMGIRIAPTIVRYPDLSIVCRDDWLEEEDVKAFEDPIVVIEILSPSTTTFDQGTKLHEYQSVPSLRTIAFVDPINRLTRVHHRRGAEEWLDTGFSQPHNIDLPAISICLSEAEIFTAL